MTQKIAIVGSGFLGMTLALRLAESGAKVTLFESADHIGGLASTWQIGEVTWDRHYHVTLASDTHTRDLVEELGLGEDFRWAETKTGFYTDGKLVSMSDVKEFLQFPPLGLYSKLRLGATIFWASRVKDWERLELITAEKWLTRLSGKSTFEKIWKPLLKAKLGEAYQETSAAFIWATIQRMYAARSSGLKKEQFGYVRGGYARVLERLGAVLLEKGVEIRLNAKVESIQKLKSGVMRVETSLARRAKDVKTSVTRQVTKYADFQATAAVARGFSGAFISEPGIRKGEVVTFPETANTAHFDKVILTCPSAIAAKVLVDADPREREALRTIKYQGIVCASVLTRCPLSRFYVTNITDESPFTGVIEMTALVNKKEFDGKTLIYLPKYVSPDDELFDKTDEQIERSFLKGLEAMYPNFRRNDVVAFKVSRVRRVFPIPVLDYSAKLPSMKTSVDGVYVVNSSHIVNGTLNVNETVQLAERFFADNFGTQS
jgi:protoporphyrinogen oxidase